MSQIPDAVDTVVCAPDDGWWYHPKHVEQFPDKINRVTLHLVGHILEIKLDFKQHFYMYSCYEVELFLSRWSFLRRKLNPLKIIIFLQFHNHHTNFLLQHLSLAQMVNHVTHIFLLRPLLENGISGM